MSDSEYLDAVRRGDMKTAQRMVDAAAENAGYGTEKLYHGNETGPFKSIERPLFLSASKNEAKAYSEETDIEAFTKQTLIPIEKSEVQFPSRMDLMKSWPIASDFVGKPFTPQATADGELFYWDGTTNAYGDNNIVFISNRIADDSGKVVSGKPSVQESVGPSVTPFIGTYYVGGRLLPVRDSRFAEPGHPSAVNVIATRLGGDRGLTEKWSMLLKRGGYSGIDTFSDDGLERGIRVRNVVMFDPTQIKSADPVTYDDAGQVIPLSRRVNSESPDIRNPYTRPDLRERLKRKIIAGSKGGNPGQWSARKAQLLAAEYEKAGGGYTGKRSASQRSLSKWTKEDWRTKSGKPSLETGERYLPAAAITALTSAEYAETSRAKRKATGQFSRQPKRIAMKTSEFRNPKDPRSAMTQITGTEDTYINASKMLGGKVLDYGAGRGIGTDALRSNGLLADSFEPFPENWEGKRPPTYTDSANIPSDSYDSLVSFSVINVVDPDERKFLFQEVARILRPDGVALITGRDRQDVQKATTKIPHLEEGGYLIGKGKLQRYQKGFTQAELERYAKEVLGPGFTVEANRALNGASIKITKGKPNPAKRNAVRSKLSRIIEPGDRILCYDTASGEDFYRLWDVIHTAMPMTKEALVEVEGMLDDDGVLVIESGETPAGLQDHFRRATRYNGLLLVQGPKNPEQARIETEKLRRELE
jgi:SAM-dependent methyltransferase